MKQPFTNLYIHILLQLFTPSPNPKFPNTPPEKEAMALATIESQDHTTIPDLNPTDLQIFILSGQSNMSGRGGVIRKPLRWDGVVPPECRRNPSVLRLNAHLRWEIAAEPLHADIDSGKVCGVGPGMSFANAVAGGGSLGLVPCAVGGTAIKEWARGQKLYEQMVKRSRESVGLKKGSEIKALLWFQGESDTMDEHEAKGYRVKMEEFIHNVREDLHLPLLPIIQVALASGGDERYIEIVREAQKGIDIPNVVCVDAKGLKLSEDNLHLSTEAQVQLGHMLADAYLSHFVAAP